MLTLSPKQLPRFTSALSDYEREALAFCREWQAGKEEFVLYTSGSTGRPKPITLHRQQLQASAQMTGEALGLRAGDHALVCLNTGYIAGTMMLVRAMVLNLRLTLIAPGGNPLTEFSSSDTFDFVALVPLQLRNILQQTPEKIPALNRMKAILVGGAPVSQALEAEIQSLTAPVYSTYGMTETVSHIALRRLNGPQRSELYTTLPGVEIGLDNRQCLWIKAPSTLYQTVQTNDRAEITQPGSFRWLGRVDHVINSGGIKIQPEETETQVEKVLHRLGISSRVAAFGLPHATLGEALCVALETSPLPEATERAMKQALAEFVDPYRIPKHFLYLNPFPQTPTEKIDRRQIAAHFSQAAPEQSFTDHAK